MSPTTPAEWRAEAAEIGQVVIGMIRCDFPEAFIVLQARHAYRAVERAWLAEAQSMDAAVLA